MELKIFGFNRKGEEEYLAERTSEEEGLPSGLCLVGRDEDPHPTLIGKYAVATSNRNTIYGRYLGVNSKRRILIDNHLFTECDHTKTCGGDVVGVRIESDPMYVREELIEDIRPFNREELELMVEQINTRCRENGTIQK